MSACLCAKMSISLVLVCNVSSMKQLGVFYFTNGRDASPLKGYLLAFDMLVPIYMYTPGWSEALQE